VVRNEKNVDDLKKKSTIIAQSLNDKRLEFAIIPEFEKKDAFFNALDSITVIIHLASPLAIEVILPPPPTAFIFVAHDGSG
jgi:hypothetical protein